METGLGNFGTKMGDQNVNNSIKKTQKNAGKHQKHIVNPGFQQRSKQANLSADRIHTKGQYIKVANWVISQRLSFYLPTDEITS